MKDAPDLTNTNRMGSVAFESSEEFVPLQAADLLSQQLRRHVLTQGREATTAATVERLCGNGRVQGQRTRQAPDGRSLLALRFGEPSSWVEESNHDLILGARCRKHGRGTLADTAWETFARGVGCRGTRRRERSDASPADQTGEQKERRASVLLLRPDQAREAVPPRPGCSQSGVGHGRRRRSPCSRNCS
jgi:hypothetical protein